MQPDENSSSSFSSSNSSENICLWVAGYQILHLFITEFSCIFRSWCLPNWRNETYFQILNLSDSVGSGSKVVKNITNIASRGNGQQTSLMHVELGFLAVAVHFFSVQLQKTILMTNKTLYSLLSKISFLLPHTTL